MKSFFEYIFRFLRFYFSAKTRFGIHSPFVFSFIKNVLEDRRNFYAFWEIQVLKADNLKSQTGVKTGHFGAGSKINSGKKRMVADIVKSGSIPSFWGKLLFRSVLHFKPKTILELGTSAGFSTLYLASADQRAKVFTLEANAELMQLARSNFKQAGLKNVILREGLFQDVLPKVLEQIERLDFVFFDGDHRAEPMKNYFRQCLAKADENAVFVFDDIHWSSEMEEFWKWVQAQNEVKLSLDFFRLGMIFFNPDFKEKQHFKIVPYRWKPWQIW